MRKHQQTQSEELSTKKLTSTVKALKNKKRLRNGHRPEETKATRQLNATWYPGLDPGTEKKISGKTGEM